MFKKLSTTQVESMCDEILAYLLAEKVHTDVNVYANNKRYSFYPTSDNMPYDNIDGVFISKDNIDVTSQLEYSNPDTVTMTFEGSLYYYINICPDSAVIKGFSEILSKYGCYYEQGHAWSLAVYQDKEVP